MSSELASVWYGRVSLVVLFTLWWSVSPTDSLGQTDSLSVSENERCFPRDGSLNFDPSGWKTDFCVRSVDLYEISSGGPPRDGIPPIDAPSFVTTGAAAGWLKSNEPVILLEIEGDARAYPLQILTWHEIVNDIVGSVPVVVTFCPLCNSAIVFERPLLDDRALTFGTSGNLRRSDLVMWDRQTESWWQQFSGDAIVGTLTGKRLKAHRAPVVAWQTFLNVHPTGRVLSRDTGHDRPYGRNPYPGYDDVNESPFLFEGDIGGELRAMARIVGLEHRGAPRAYPIDEIARNDALNDTLGGDPIVLLRQSGTASALDADRIADGRDVGSSGAFLRTVGTRVLTFGFEGEGEFVDEETGSTWNVLGQATSGPLEGERLMPVEYHEVFWFVWSSFHTDTSVYGIESRE